MSQDTIKQVLHKRTDEHEKALRKQNTKNGPNVTSAPAYNAITTGHNIARNNINILSTAFHRSQLVLLELAGIRTRDSQINRNAAAPNINSIWNPLLSKIILPSKQDRPISPTKTTHDSPSCILTSYHL